MPYVAIGFNEVPTQIGLKGTAIEGIVGFSLILGILLLYVWLSFARHFKTRRQLRAQGFLPTNRGARLDPVEGVVNNIQPPPPAYDSLHAGTGRQHFQPQLLSDRVSGTLSRVRNDYSTHDPSNTSIERTSSPCVSDHNPPSSSSSEGSILPPYCGPDPYGLPNYESLIYADEEDRLRNLRPDLATGVSRRTRDDAFTGRTAIERRGEIVILEREITSREA